MGKQNRKVSPWPRAADIEQVPRALESLLFVLWDGCALACQLQHLIEVVTIPAHPHDHDHILELRTLYAMLG